MPIYFLWVEFLYRQASRLYLGDKHIMSATGVQQDNTLLTLLFSLLLHPLIHQFKDSCKLLFHAWYLDDGTLVGDSNEAAKALNIIREFEP